jgi:hypothetical protein
MSYRYMEIDQWPTRQTEFLPEIITERRFHGNPYIISVCLTWRENNKRDLPTFVTTPQRFEFIWRFFIPQYGNVNFPGRLQKFLHTMVV